MCENKAEHSSDNKLMDHRFHVMSYEQFILDNKVKKFNKICMIKIINADTTIATLGEEKYNRTCAEFLAIGNEAYKQMGIGHIIHVYAHTYKSFMAVANDEMSDEDFYNLMKANYEQYEVATSQQTDISGVSRFALAFGDNLINRINSVYYVNRNLQNNFLVAQNEWELLALESEENFKVFDLINHAINHDKVVPFYQGIRNNENGKIEKYEALMRIYDQEGKVCPPGMFLPIAKKFKLYLTLSKIIIDKALSEFENSECDLGINISLLDIQSDEFQEWFIERLKKYPNPTKVVLEFVETENYNTDNEIFGFLMKVREIGCKIAIDDFGVGFATYASVISLKPDIIKVDGEIIRNLATNEDSRIILDSIHYMADLIGAKTVAEFVENEEIQEVVLKNGIDYSQGYLFAKPEPYDKIQKLI